MNHRAVRAIYVFEMSRTGRDALKVLKENVYDCVVLDLRLPDMSGWDLCREIRTPHTNEAPPIIMLTPEVSKMCAEDSAKAGCNAWLAHPTVAAYLLPATRNACLSTPAPNKRSAALPPTYAHAQRGDRTIAEIGLESGIDDPVLQFQCWHQFRV